MVKTWKKVLLCGAVLALLGFLWIWSQDPFGVSLEKMEADARQSQQVPEGWACASDAGEETAGLLFYPRDGGTDDFAFSVYARNGGFSFGYFFRAGGRLGTIADTAAVYEEDGAFWALKQDGEDTPASADQTPIQDGDAFSLVYTVA